MSSHEIMTTLQQRLRPSLSTTLSTTALILFAFYVFAFPFIPMQDYPEWLYTGLALHGMMTGHSLGQAFSIEPHLAPNVMFTVFTAWLSFLFPIMVAGKLVILSTMGILFLGVRDWIRWHAPTRHLLAIVAAFMMAFNYSFFHGNLSHMAGQGLALFLSVRILRDDMLTRKPVVVAGAFCICYLTHFFSFLTLGLILAITLIRRQSWRAMLTFGLTVLPSAMLFLHYLVSIHGGSPSPSENPQWNAWASAWHDRIMVILRYLMILPGFQGIATPVPLLLYAVNLATLAGSGVLFLLALRRWWPTRPNGFEPYALAALTGFLALVLPLEGHKVSALNERCLLLFSANVITVIIRDATYRVRPLLATLILLGVLVYGNAVWATHIFCAVSHTHLPMTERSSHLQMHDPFIRIPYYDAIESHRPMPCFDTGLIRSQIISNTR